MKYLAIIPARYASTRFPGKPLADIQGKPMIQHVYERSRASFDDCYVATDDPRIFDTVENFGGKAVMTSACHRNGTERCREALDIIENAAGMRFDVVVNIQGDEPFIDTEQLAQLKNCFDREDTEIATLIKAFSPEEDIFNPNIVKIVTAIDGAAIYFSRTPIPCLRDAEKSSWQQQHTYYKHIGLYGFTPRALREITALPASELEKAESLEPLRWIENGYTVRTAVTTIESKAVDTPEDLKNL